MKAIQLIFAILIIISSYTTALADEQEKLNTEQIKAFLTEHYVKGDFQGSSWTSYFYENGDTSYSANNNRPSIGRWKAENDLYCSQWPPSKSWDCYVVTANGNNLTFVPTDDSPAWPAVRVVK